jgi:5-carboxymethyl-2-hydroxymuconate isomerase
MGSPDDVFITVGVFGALVTVIQALGLWILGDIRRRVERLEAHLMASKLQ